MDPCCSETIAGVQALSEGPPWQRKVPSNAKYYGVTFGEHRNPSAEEVEQAAQTVVMICFKGSDKLY
jgi:hypothetical protein